MENRTRQLILILSLTASLSSLGGLVGCLPNSDRSSLDLYTGSPNEVDSSSPDTGSESGLLQLSQVVLNRANPQTQIDLVGSGNQIGLYCADGGITGTPDGGSDSTSAACTCHFDFVRNDGSHESFEVNPLYQESNLIRCDYSGIPSGLDYVKVKVRLTKVDQYSNELTLRFAGSSVILNPQDSASFNQVQRYQCRDAVFIPYQYQDQALGALYDPIQSEDPTLSVALNFYTLNMGQAMQHFLFNPAARPQNGAGWICPPQANDPAYGTNLTLYSKKSDGGSSTIFPTAGSRTDRANFFLARAKTGVFTLAVNAFTAPNTLTQEINAGTNVVGSPGPLGYGAHPTPGSNETESCPGPDVKIPVGYKWAKLWLFRASMEPRKFKKSEAFLGSAWLGCNPGTWPGWDHTDPTNFGPHPQVFKDCGGDDDGGAFTGAELLASNPFAAGEPSGGWTANSTGTILADRIIGNTQQCLRTNRLDLRDALPGATPVCDDRTVRTGAGCTTYGDLHTPAAERGTQKTEFSEYAKGTDLWARSGADESLRCATSDTTFTDHLNVCRDLGIGGLENYSILHDRNLTEEALDNGVSRYDFVFVVSPTNIMSKHFKNNAAEALPYTPYRFLSPTDCKSADPENPDTDGDCPSNRKQSYEFKAHDVGSNGDASSDATGRLPVFPVCVLQAVAS